MIRGLDYYGFAGMQTESHFGAAANSGCPWCQCDRGHDRQTQVASASERIETALRQSHSLIQQGTFEKVYQTSAVFIGGDLPINAMVGTRHHPWVDRLPARCSTGKMVSLPLQ